MEAKLDSLIEKIKKDGILEAQKEAASIVSEAKSNASKIVENARSEARRIVEEAQKEAERIKLNAEAAIKQAARDTVLATKEKIIELFNKVLLREVSDSLDSELVGRLIKYIVENWVDKQSAEVLVSQEDVSKLEALLTERLKEELREAIEIKPDPSIAKGFKIGLKGENLYYDFTDETMTEILKSYLTPSVRDILEK
ncbi:MAG: hypothetical protein DRP88_00030 [Candidatus Neomarinimicrobiota bacterium]|nr:MAG: hypothetical protein DRP88_00030 [Candidatus Neomarinimicrobiota bacterium]HDN59568.1 hypothetical protein [Candidatus Neomarinimicrobiota bacterium]